MSSTPEPPEDSRAEASSENPSGPGRDSSANFVLPQFAGDFDDPAPIPHQPSPWSLRRSSTSWKRREPTPEDTGQTAADGEDVSAPEAPQASPDSRPNPDTRSNPDTQPISANRPNPDPQPKFDPQPSPDSRPNSEPQRIQDAAPGDGPTVNAAVSRENEPDAADPIAAPGGEVRADEESPSDVGADTDAASPTGKPSDVPAAPIPPRSREDVPASKPENREAPSPRDAAVAGERPEPVSAEGRVPGAAVAGIAGAGVVAAGAAAATSGPSAPPPAEPIPASTPGHPRGEEPGPATRPLPPVARQEPASDAGAPTQGMPRVAPQEPAGDAGAPTQAMPPVARQEPATTPNSAATAAAVAPAAAAAAAADSTPGRAQASEEGTTLAKGSAKKKRSGGKKAGGPGGKGPGGKGPKGKKSGGAGKAWFWSITAIVLVLGGAYLVAVFLTSGNSGRDATIAGVDVSNRSTEEVKQVLDEELAPRAEAPVDLKAKDLTKETTAQDLGLTLDTEASARRVSGLSWDPAVIIERLTGTSQITPVVRQGEGYPGALAKATGGLQKEAVDAGISFENEAPKATPAEDGFSVDKELAPAAVAEQFPSENGDIEVPLTTVTPEVGDEAANTALQEIATPAVSEDVTVKTGEGDLKITPKMIAKTLSFEARDGKLEPKFNADELRKTTLDKNPAVGKEAKDASFTIKGGKPEVVPSEKGVSVKPGELADAVIPALTSSDRSAEVELKESDADFTTEDAEKADVSDEISKFATPYSSSPARDTNLRVASKQVSGTVLQPGEQFSLNETLGERTAANGYKQAGVISDGEMKEDFGGGVSQVSTTLFNAAFFAGFSLDEHRAHSRYISRYPEGRESTLDWTSIDLKFTNTSKTPVVLDMYLKDGEVNARVFGVKTVDVDASESSRFAFASPGTLDKSGPTCKPQAPKEGWSITIYRTIKETGTGKVVKKDDFTTIYRPVNRINCED